MTSDLGAGPEPGELETDAIVGRTELTLHDCTSVWAALPQHRRAFVHLGLLLLAVSGLQLRAELLKSGSAGGPLQISWPVAAAPVLGLGLLVLAMCRARSLWAREAVAVWRGAEGVEFRFDSAGFSFQAPEHQFRHAWSSLYRCIETAQAFVIYTGPATLMVVPKRAFAALEQARLRARLLEHVPNRQLGGTLVWPPPGRTLLLWLALALAYLAIWQLMGHS